MNSKTLSRRYKDKLTDINTLENLNDWRREHLLRGKRGIKSINNGSYQKRLRNDFLRNYDLLIKAICYGCNNRRCSISD
jgi:hypothetical protein